VAIDLIYCADGNRRKAEIAINHGFRYGARLPARGLPFPPWFADQDWKEPNRERYMAELAEHKPHMATVLDLDQADQLPEVLGWAEDAAMHIDVVLIIPKITGIIARLPRRIGAAEVRLAYSVPTRYGGTSVPVWEFAGWPVHLLGGSPHRQMELVHYLDVRSVDGNMHNLMANKHAQFWVPGTARYASNRWWPTLREANDGVRLDADDLPYLAFEMSCHNIMSAWQKYDKAR